MSKLELQERDRSLSIAIFSKDKKDENGNTLYGACLQRSYLSKESQEWKREQINLYPEELLKLSILCSDTYSAYRKLAQSQRADRQETREYPAQAYNDPAPSSFGEPPAYLNDDPLGL